MKDEKKIARYLIRGLLGEGAMGSVFKGYDPNLERIVAIKTMRTGNISDPQDYEEFKERFFLESRVYAKLNHPNIVNVFDCGIDEKEPFLVMEFINGNPLQNYIRDQGEARYQTCTDILSQIASGLDYAHRQGVIHRDIKPGNILVDDNDRAKIVDFGLAKLNDSNLTQTGLFLGTPNYSSPEQVISGRVDYRSDLYSFSTVAYELITNRLPFEAGSLHAILYQIANEAPKIALEPFQGILDIKALAKVFARAFAKKPEDRFQTASDFIKAIKPLLRPLKKVRCLIANEQAVVAESSEPPSKPPPIPVTPAKANHSGAAISLRHQAPGDVTTHRRALIESARNQFQAAFRTRNLSSIRYCLAELRSMGADVVVEEKAVAELEAILDAQQAADRERQRHQTVEKARREFRVALEANNLPSSRYCLVELNKLGVNTDAESHQLAQLEKKSQKRDEERKAKKEAEKRRERTVAKLKAEFQVALNRKDIPFCEKLLHHLENEGQKVKAEKTALNHLKDRLAREEDQRRQWIRKTRQSFQRSLAMRDVEGCQRVLLELKNLLKVNVGAETAALSHLEADIRREEAAELSRHLINEAQAGFAHALQQKDLKACRRIFREFIELEGDDPERKDDIATMKTQLESLEAAQLKLNMVQNTRQKFRDALKRKNPENCKYYLRELSQLGVNIEEEQKALSHLKKELDGNTDSFSTGKNVTRAVAGFQEALEAGDLGRCNQFLSELERFGVEVKNERKSLQGLIRREGTSDKLRQDMIRSAKRGFMEGLELRQVDHCRYQLKILKECGAEIDQEKRQFDLLRREVSASPKVNEEPPDEEKLKQRMIEQFRFEFVRAYQAGQIDNCRYYVHELEQLGAKVASEKQALEVFDN